MSTLAISYTQGTPVDALAILSPIGEDIDITVTMLTTAGEARNCAGGKIAVFWEPRGGNGARNKVEVDGQAGGIHSIKLEGDTTKLLSGVYNLDIWYTDSGGNNESCLELSVLTMTKGVGPFGAVQASSVYTDQQIAAALEVVPKVFGTVALARSNADPSETPYIYVIGRGMFTWTTAAGTDTGTELTSYITGTGGGFVFESGAYRDYTETATPPYQAYRVYGANNSLNLMTEFSDVTIQLGEENQAPAYNDELTTIANGKAVYVSGAQGQRLAVKLAASGAGVGCKVYGLATHNISSHADGRITTFGLVRGLNTQAWSAGGEIFTSTVAGTLSQTEPAGDVDGARIGIVCNSHPTDGTVFVFPRSIPQLAHTTATRSTSERLGTSRYNTTTGRPEWWDGDEWIPTGGVLSVPSAYQEVSTPAGTTSATLEDVAGSSFTITLARSGYILVNASFELQTQSGASASTIGVALVYDAHVEAEYQRYLSGTNDLGIGAISARTELLDAGEHTIKLQFRRVSGVATPGINKADIMAMVSYLNSYDPPDDYIAQIHLTKGATTYNVTDLTIGNGITASVIGSNAILDVVSATPTAHASTHNAGGSDALAIDAAAATGSLRTLGTSSTSACAGNDSRLSDARTPTSHASTHNAGGADALAIDAAAATGSLRTLGTTATSACAGNDSRLSDARTPTAHASTHVTGGGDAIQLATTGQPGLMSATQAAQLNALAADQYATTSSDTALTTDSSTSVLAVTLTDLDASSNYVATIGVRLTLNSTVANSGYVDIQTMCTIATDGSSVATVTFPIAISPDTGKLPSAISTATGTVSASTGGFTIYATRVAGTAMVASAETWIISRKKVTAA